MALVTGEGESYFFFFHDIFEKIRKKKSNCVQTIFIVRGGPPRGGMMRGRGGPGMGMRGGPPGMRGRGGPPRGGRGGHFPPGYDIDLCIFYNDLMNCLRDGYIFIY